MGQETITIIEEQRTTLPRRSYRKIKAWQMADDLVMRIYEISKEFPRSETYGLTTQIRRAAVSVAANIVEGASRHSKKEYAQFLYLSRGSLEEVSYYLDLAHRLGFLPPSAFEDVHAQYDTVARVLHGLIRAVTDEI